MKKDRSGPHPRPKIEELLGRVLQLNSGEIPEGECLNPETMALLVEGKLSGKKKDRALNHLAKCLKCHDIFLLSFDLDRKQKTIEKFRPKPVLLRPLALAASLLVVVTSLFILYKTGNLPGISDRSAKEILTQTKPLPFPEEKEFQRKKTQGEAGTGEKAEIRPVENLKKSLEETDSDKKDAPAFADEKTGGVEVSKKNLPGTQRALEIPRPEKTDESFADKEKSKKGGPVRQPPPESPRAKSEIQTAEKEISDTLLTQPVPTETAESMRAGKQATAEEVVDRYPDGRARTVNTYRRENNQPVLSNITEFDRQGRIISVTDPAKHTLQKRGYYPNGNRKFIENYQNQKPHGLWIKWDIEGKIIEKIEYRHGKADNQTLAE